MGDLARVSRATVALAILDNGRDDESASPRYLLRFSHEWRQWNLVGGHVRPYEDRAVCMARKLASELRLAPRRIHVVRNPLFSLAYDSVSLRTGEPTRYEIDVFAASLRIRSLPLVTDGQMNLWLTADEIHEGVAPGDTLVSEMSIRVVDSLFEWVESARPREAASL